MSRQEDRLNNSIPTVIVGRPRATDAVGKALRNAFERPHELPADMSVSLKRLDRLG